MKVLLLNITLSLLSGPASMSELILAFIVIGFIGGVIASLIYCGLLLFFPDKKVKTKDILILFGVAITLTLGYVIFLFLV